MKNKRRNETNPWLGLAPYKEGMSFWGRSKECILLSEIIKNNNASIVFGKSGIGKTSLMNAGISPVLRKDNYIPIPIRFVHNSDVTYSEQIVTKIKETVICEDNLPSNIEPLGLWDFFHRHTFYNKERTVCTPVIILDQFEEIYTLTKAENKGCICDFFQELSYLLNDIKPDNVLSVENGYMQKVSTLFNSSIKIIKHSKSSRFHYSRNNNFRIVICLREDKLFLLERNSSNIPSLKANRFNLQELTTDGAMDVIISPCLGLFTKNDALNIINKLSNINEEGTKTIEPAILSLFLYKYFEKGINTNYDNIFSDYYLEATKDIKEDSLFLLEKNLLTLNGYRNQIPLDDIVSLGVTIEEIHKLLKRIILRTEKRKGIEYIEFSHDRLCIEAKKNREKRQADLLALRAKRKIFIICIILLFSIIVSCFFFRQNYKLKKYQENLKELNSSLQHQVNINDIQNHSLKILNKRLEQQIIQNEKKTDSLNEVCIMLKTEKQLTSFQKKRIVKVTNEKNNILNQFILLKERIDNNNKQSKVLKTINQTERMPNSTATFNDENNNEIVDEITTINTKTKKTLNIINQ